MGWPLRADTIPDWLGCISRSNSRDVPSGVGTIAWKLQREIILLLGWGRPFCSSSRIRSWLAVSPTTVLSHRALGSIRRLHRTLDAMLGLCFKTEREALAVVARINAIHDSVNGRLTEAAGIFPAGTSYSAHDPSLLAWVQATMLDMTCATTNPFVTPLRIEEKDTDPGRHQNGRGAGEPAAYQVRAGHQPLDRQSTRSDDPAVTAAAAGGPGNRAVRPRASREV
jgi:ER-bound oxygenase mpaB/B'/Rubber oxygenase, catalytic domain